LYVDGQLTCAEDAAWRGAGTAFIAAQEVIHCFWHSEIYYTNALLLLVGSTCVVMFVAQKQLIDTCMEIRKVDVRLPAKGNSNSHGARPVHLIITMIKWNRTSRLSIKNSLSVSHDLLGGF